MFDGQGLLIYNSDYNVLICPRCQYAVQTSALDSHLRRHKVYRGDRQRLLSACAKLVLPEPDDVQLPESDSPPIDGLPVLPGLKCSFSGCGRLCASVKRMRRHWSESHGVKEPPETCSRHVYIQTFFRGTKIRYFEVTLPAGVVVDLQENSETPSSTEPVLAERSVQKKAPEYAIDIDVLRLFYYFTTTTMYTIQDVKGSDFNCQQSPVALALRYGWLMAGFLALTLTQMPPAMVEQALGPTAQTRHGHYIANFFTGFRESESGYEADTAAAPGFEEAARLICMLRCMNWNSLVTIPPTETIPFSAWEFMQAIHGCFDTEAAIQCVAKDHALVKATAQPHNILDTPVFAPMELRETLFNLPRRMREALGEQSRSSDFFAMMTAIPDLTRCCSLSYKSDSAQDAWTGMVAWSQGLPFHFYDMIKMNKPHALVVVAHWSLLIERAERHSWFLQGSSARLMRYVKQELPEYVFNSPAMPKMNHG